MLTLPSSIFISAHSFNSSEPSHNPLFRIFLLCSRRRPRDRVRPPTSTLHMKMIWYEYYIDWHCSNLQPVTCFKAGGYSLFMYYASWPVAHTLFPIGLLCITLGYILRSTVSTRPSSYSSHRRVDICYVTLTTDIGTSQYNTSDSMRMVIRSTGNVQVRKVYLTQFCDMKSIVALYCSSHSTRLDRWLSWWYPVYILLNLIHCFWTRTTQRVFPFNFYLCNCIYFHVQHPPCRKLWNCGRLLNLNVDQL